MSSARLRVARLVVVGAVGLSLALVGCGSSAEEDEAARQARMTLDDGARPVEPGQSTLSGGFDRSTAELRAAMPTTQLRSQYTEVQAMAAETLIPSEAAGCEPDAVREPELPATELMATRPAAVPSHQPDVANVVAARARTEAEAEQLVEAAAEAAAGCASFTVELKDLGEGSFSPAEQGSTTLTPVDSQHWVGIRTTANVTLTGRGWTQELVRESLLLRRGQIVVHVRVQGSDGVQSRVDSLSQALTSAIEGDQGPQPTSG